MSKLNIHFNQASEAVTLVDRDSILPIVDILSLVRKNGGHVWICGNGGSHSTASHFANDLIKQNRIKAVCLGDETSTMLAYGNDNGWENMFADAINARFEDGDCVFGISCSGNSENVIKALGVAENRGWAVGLTGLSSGSKMAKMGLDGLVFVPVPDIRVQEDIHLLICHAIVRALQDAE